LVFGFEIPHLRLRQEGIDLTKQALGGIGAHQLDVSGMGFGGNTQLEENPWKLCG
jgi:hypothetical protein